MAGLLDFFGSGWDDPKSNAVMALAGGLLDGDFASGVKGYANVMQGAGEAKFQKAMQQAKLDELTAQTGLKQEQVKQAIAKAEEGKRIQGLVANAGRSRMGMGEPSILNEALPEGMRVAPIQQQNGIDYQNLYQQGVPFDALKDLAATRNLGREEIARIQDIEGQGGAKILQGFDKYGSPVGQGAIGYLAPQLVNQGDKQSFVKPVAGVSLQMGQTPDSKASSALGWANHGISAANLNLSRQRLDMDKADPKLAWNSDLGGFVNPRTREVLPALDANGAAMPLAKAEKPMTDAQSKAALFGSRMESSDNIINNLAKSGTQKSIPLSNAGFGVGDAITALSSGNQQQLQQAKRDFVNATLRRESGAVISDSEFANAEKQYFPQIGDSESTIAQKANNRAIAVRGVQSEIPRSHKGVVSEIIGGGKSTVPAQPMRGMVMGGYRFKGGDPAKQENWEKQ